MVTINVMQIKTYESTKYYTLENLDTNIHGGNNDFVESTEDNTMNQLKTKLVSLFKAVIYLNSPCSRHTLHAINKLNITHTIFTIDNITYKVYTVDSQNVTYVHRCNNIFDNCNKLTTMCISIYSAYNNFDRNNDNLETLSSVINNTYFHDSIFNNKSLIGGNKYLEYLHKNNRDLKIYFDENICNDDIEDTIVHYSNDSNNNMDTFQYGIAPKAFYNLGDDNEDSFWDDNINDIDEYHTRKYEHDDCSNACLFDLSKDPCEYTNIIESKQDIATRLILKVTSLSRMYEVTELYQTVGELEVDITDEIPNMDKDGYLTSWLKISDCDGELDFENLVSTAFISIIHHILILDIM